jgi:O-antigen/teichoic acid export membrane protein
VTPTLRRPVRTRTAFSRLVTRARSDRLYWSSLLLVVNTVLLAGFGFLYWALAARLYDAQAVGLTTTLTAGIGLASTIAALGLPNAVIKLLPRGDVGVVRASFLTASIFGSSLALAASVVLARYLSSFAAVTRTDLGWFFFAVTVAGSTLGAIGDAALLSVRSVEWTIGKNLVVSVTKVALVVVLRPLDADGVLLSFALSVLVSSALTLFAVRRRVPARRESRGRPFRLLDHWHFVAANYGGTIFGILPTTLLPLLVGSRLGVGHAAFFGTVLLVSSFVNVVPSAVGQSLFAEGAAHTAGIPATARRALRGVYAVLAPVSVALFLGAGPLLSIFGNRYATNGATCLRLFTLGALFIGVNYVIDSVLNAQGRGAAYMFMNVFNAVAVIGFALLLMKSGLTGVGAGWLLGQSTSALVGIVVVLAAGTVPATATATATVPATVPATVAGRWRTASLRLRLPAGSVPLVPAVAHRIPRLPREGPPPPREPLVGEPLVREPPRPPLSGVGPADDR